DLSRLAFAAEEHAALFAREWRQASVRTARGHIGSLGLSTQPNQLGDDLVRALGAVLRPLAEQPIQKLHQLSWPPADEAADAGEGLRVQHAGTHAVEARALERIAPGEREEEAQPERVEIGADAWLLAEPKLGGHEERRAAEGAGLQG